MRKNLRFFCLGLICLGFLFPACMKNTKPATGADSVTINDGLNRSVTLPAAPGKIICSGSGCLRYITYLQCQDQVIAVDSIEKEATPFDARPYAFANPGFKALPLFGEFRGNDNPELISALSPQPDLIFKIFGTGGYDPGELQRKTGIPVVALEYGNIGKNRETFYQTLTMMGQIMHRSDRAQAIRNFIDDIIADLAARTTDIEKRPSCFIGGVAYRGPMGFQSTEPGYPPFLFLNTPNAAIDTADAGLNHMDVSKEKIVEWDPEIIFIDLATFQSAAEANALYELIHDPAYGALQAKSTGRVYGVLPYNWYTQNHGSTLANAYFIGKILYPRMFADIDPVQKADEIYNFLVGKAVFKEINTAFDGKAFTKLEL